jgi:acid stress-induced BolA-like protein IbaG/YrbA
LVADYIWEDRQELPIMPITAQDIEDLIRERLPNAKIIVEGDDGVHFSAQVVDESFRGMNRVQQQRTVYAALKGKMDGAQGEVHALALTTKAPE